MRRQFTGILKIKLPEILMLWPWKWEYVNLWYIIWKKEWTLNSHFVSVADTDTSFPTEKISCNVTPFFYHHSVVIQHLVSNTLYQTGNFLWFQRKTYIMCDKYLYSMHIESNLLKQSPVLKGHLFVSCDRKF